MPHYRLCLLEATCSFLLYIYNPVLHCAWNAAEQHVFQVETNLRPMVFVARVPREREEGRVLETDRIKIITLQAKGRMQFLQCQEVDVTTTWYSTLEWVDELVPVLELVKNWVGLFGHWTWRIDAESFAAEAEFRMPEAVLSKQMSMVSRFIANIAEICPSEFRQTEIPSMFEKDREGPVERGQDLIGYLWTF